MLSILLIVTSRSISHDFFCHNIFLTWQYFHDILFTWRCLSTSKWSTKLSKTLFLTSSLDQKIFDSKPARSESKWDETKLTRKPMCGMFARNFRSARISTRKKYNRAPTRKHMCGMPVRNFRAIFRAETLGRDPKTHVRHVCAEFCAKQNRAETRKPIIAIIGDNMYYRGAPIFGQRQ